MNYVSALISLFPNCSWNMENAYEYSTLIWTDSSHIKPTKKELDDEIARLEAQAPFDACKAQAKTLIAASDWSVLPDVGLANKADYETYRAELRNLIINPVAEPVFPTEPQPVWE